MILQSLCVFSGFLQGFEHVDGALILGLGKQFAERKRCMSFVKHDLFTLGAAPLLSIPLVPAVCFVFSHNEPGALAEALAELRSTLKGFL